MCCRLNKRRTKDETKIKNSNNGEATGPINLLYILRANQNSKPNGIQIKSRHNTPRSLFLAVGHCASRRNSGSQHPHQSQAAPTGEIPTCGDPSPAARCRTHPIATRFHSVVYPESRYSDDLLLPPFFVSLHFFISTSISKRHKTSPETHLVPIPASLCILWNNTPLVHPTMEVYLLVILLFSKTGAPHVKP